MTETAWLDILARVTAHAPVDLDDLLLPDPPQPTREVAPDSRAEAPMSARIWRRIPERSHIGIRVDTPPGDRAGEASRLAAMAVERAVVPILLTTEDASGFEQFGFRVERLPEGPADLKEAFEAELRAFWDMPLVIDLSELGPLP